MAERNLTGHEVNYELEYIEDENDFQTYLDNVAPYIGWIVIYFNSLEDHISDFIREAILRDPFHDERLDVFLSEMMFAGKCKALINLYGQIIESENVGYSHNDLNNLELMLIECSKRRNEYAHADWIGARKEGFVRVKSKSKKTGIVHKYKKFEISELENDVNYINEARHFLCEFNDNIQSQLYQNINYMTNGTP
jgi:hypothetical protein